MWLCEQPGRRGRHRNPWAAFQGQWLSHVEASGPPGEAVLKHRSLGPAPGFPFQEVWDGTGQSALLTGSRVMVLAGRPDCWSVEMALARCCLHLHLSEDKGPLRTSDPRTWPATRPGSCPRRWIPEP